MSDLATDFLYWNTPLGCPDSSIRLGVAFEVGGAYEDWGFVVEKDKKVIAEGRTLKEAIENATRRIKEDFASDPKAVKCSCGNRATGYKLEGEKKIPICFSCIAKA